MAETIIAEVGNVTIVTDGNKFGLKDKSNSITTAIKYESIEEWPVFHNKKILKVVDNGLIGFYDAIKVDWICHCTLTSIIRYDEKNETIVAKQPLKILGLRLCNTTVDINLKNQAR